MVAPDEWLRLLEELLEAERRHAVALQQLADARREWAAGCADAARRVHVGEAAAERAGRCVREIRTAMNAYTGRPDGNARH